MIYPAPLNAENFDNLGGNDYSEWYALSSLKRGVEHWIKVLRLLKVSNNAQNLFLFHCGKKSFNTLDMVLIKGVVILLPMIILITIFYITYCYWSCDL